ncbi:MAG: PAS domain-containing protein [Pedosphaera sp.]|nr:PAS domain-containing protein [Pedosphaera sp.]
MWPALTILIFLAAIALHFWWRAKLRREQESWRAELARRESRAQSAATETLARQDALFDSMIEGVLVLDDAGRVQFANRAFAQMFGTTGILRGQALLEAVRVHEVTELVERASAAGRVVDHELELPGGGGRWLQVNAAALTSVDRRRLGTILVFHDLTRLKQLERTREEFVANVSHELRTPLSLIKGYTETLLDGAQNDPEVATRFLQSIERNAGRLQLLIEDLLTISQLESGHVALNLQPVALASVTEKVFADFAERGARKEITLRHETGALRAQADEVRLQQILGNLVDNAIKYGRAGGNVIVAARETGSDKIEVSVRDDGPGISAESLSRVFERFYRVDKARSRDAGGTGLGLAIVKHLVQSHGGEVWAASEVGTGTTFSFTLPAAKETPASERQMAH